MKFVRNGLLVASISLAINTAAFAEIQYLDPVRLNADKEGKYSPFRSKPTVDLMSEKDHRTYTKAIETHDCETAGRVLNRAFVQAYPQFERVRFKPNYQYVNDMQYKSDHLRWESYASTTFKDYGYCKAIRNFDVSENILVKNNIRRQKFQIYPLEMKLGKKQKIFHWRNNSILSMVYFATVGYFPALLDMAVLAQRRNILNGNNEELEYYFLKRACYHGANCDTQSSRLEELRVSIGTERISHIDMIARADLGSQPDYRQLITGKPL